MEMQRSCLLLQRERVEEAGQRTALTLECHPALDAVIRVESGIRPPVKELIMLLLRRVKSFQSQKGSAYPAAVFPAVTGTEKDSAETKLLRKAWLRVAVRPQGRHF